MGSQTGTPSVPRIVIGGTVLLVGLLLLAAQVVDLDLARLWPFFVILPGVMVLLGGLTAGAGGGGVAAIIVGSQMTGVGLLLLFQSLTGLWQTWAYAWALVWPGSIGAGLMVRGGLTGDTGMTRSGATLALIGAGLFIVGLAFFEGLLGISGSALGRLGDMALPGLLIVVGLAVVLRRR